MPKYHLPEPPEPPERPDNSVNPLGPGFVRVVNEAEIDRWERRYLAVRRRMYHAINIADREFPLPELPPRSFKRWELLAIRQWVAADNVRRHRRAVALWTGRAYARLLRARFDVLTMDVNKQN